MINVEEHMGLARKTAWQFHKYLKDKYTYDEIESTAFLGLIKAAENFDESRGFKFSTYAIPIIRFHIQIMCRDDKWNYLKRGVPHKITSLNIKIDEKNNYEMQDLLEDNEDLEESLINSILINELFNILTQREKEIIYLHFYKELKQTEIAKIVNLSQPHVSRIIINSLKKMRKALNEDISISA